MAGAAVAMGFAGRQIARARGVIKDLTLPAAADPAPPFPEGLEGKYPGIAALRTPNDDFYRIDTRLTLPVIDRDTWTLTIDGDVDNEVTLSFDDLLDDAAHRARHHPDLCLQRGRRPLRRRHPLDRRPAHRPPRPGRHRLHRGRPDPLAPTWTA